MGIVELERCVLKIGCLPEEEEGRLLLEYYQLQTATCMYPASHFSPNSNHTTFSPPPSTESNAIPDQYKQH